MPWFQHLANVAHRLRLQVGRVTRHGLTLAVAMAVLASFLLPRTVQAAVGENSKLCDRAARAAAQAGGVPLDVLQAIARTETGRSGESGLQPWPWTVNMEGIGKWFATEDEARAYVFAHFKRGARSFDVGCFQINYRWHGEAFRSIDEMFDRVAAGIGDAPSPKRRVQRPGGSGSSSRRIPRSASAPVGERRTASSSSAVRVSSSELAHTRTWSAADSSWLTGSSGLSTQ